MNALESVTTRCPYCGEGIELLVDASAGSQNYIEDCPVCCKPMVVWVNVKEDGIYVRTTGENE
ncbi:MAG TPA: CPXCG motif-containing cysteine-rich protein [Mariprofundaceae bacterium]|nr:CPXCG motif-containing cysteine-rich protein [Mariprofundaceae bacterium]